MMLDFSWMDILRSIIRVVIDYYSYIVALSFFTLALAYFFSRTKKNDEERKIPPTKKQDKSINDVVPKDKDIGSAQGLGKRAKPFSRSVSFADQLDISQQSNGPNGKDKADKAIREFQSNDSFGDISVGDIDEKASWSDTFEESNNNDDDDEISSAFANGSQSNVQGLSKLGRQLSYESFADLFNIAPWTSAMNKLKEHETFHFVSRNTKQGDGLKSIFSPESQPINPGSTTPSQRLSGLSGIGDEAATGAFVNSNGGNFIAPPPLRRETSTLNMMHKHNLAILRQIEVFSWMNDSHLRHLAKRAEVIEIEQDKFIYQHGMPVNTPSTMILISGSVDVYFTSECMNSRTLYIDEETHKVRFNEGKILTGLASLIATIIQQPTEAIGTAIVSSPVCTVMKIKHEHLVTLFSNFYGFKEEFLQRMLVRLHRVSFTAFFRVSGQYDIHVDKNLQRKKTDYPNLTANPTILALIGGSDASPYKKTPEKVNIRKKGIESTPPFTRRYFFDQISNELGVTPEELQLKDANINFPGIEILGLDSESSKDDEGKDGFGFISYEPSIFKENEPMKKTFESSLDLTLQDSEESEKFPIHLLHFADGSDIVLQQDEPAIYIVLHGRLEIVVSEVFDVGTITENTSTKDKVKHTLYPGDSVGHLLLLIGEWSEWCHSKSSMYQYRNNGVESVTWFRANGNLYVAQIPSPTYFHLVSCYPHIVEDKARRFLTSMNQYIKLIDLTSTWTHMSPHDILYREGENIHDIYIVLHGRLQAAKTRKVTSHLQEKTETLVVRNYLRGSIIGEISLFTDQPIMVTISSTKNSELAGIPKSVLQAIGQADSKMILHVGRLISNTLVGSLSRSIGGEFYSPDSKFGMGGPGSKGRYSLSAKAVAIVPASPTVPVDHFTRTLVNALRCSDNEVEIYGSSSFSLFVESQQKKLDHEFSSSLRESQDDMDDDQSKTSSESQGNSFSATRAAKQIFEKAMVLSWLNDREDENDIVIYQVDPWIGPSRWSTICLEQADVILYVANAVDDPKVSDLEQSLACVNTSAYRELVLLHIQSEVTQNFAEAEPLNTRQWIENRKGISRHHHVRFHVNNPKIDIDHYQSDFRRLGRFITGKAIGLALGGGGAKGFGHMSVIKALHKYQIPIDVIGGTSIGAYMSGLYAARGNYFHMEESVKRFADDMSSIPRTLLDLTVPVMAYTRGGAFNRVILRTFSDKKIEDMWINFFCMSTDLTDSCEIAHRNGSAWRYIRASMSLIGYLPPICDSVRSYVQPPTDNKNMPLNHNIKRSETGDYYIEKVHYLVDGGYTNILPVDVMRTMVGASGTIIAADVASESSFSYDNFGDEFSGLVYLMKYLLPYQKRPNIPWSGDIQTQLAFVASMRQFDRIQGNTRGEEDEWSNFGGTATYRTADLFLSPPVKAYSSMDFWKSKEIADRSYPYCEEKIGQFIKALVESQDPRLVSWSKMYKNGATSSSSTNVPSGIRTKARRTQSVLRLDQQQQQPRQSHSNAHLNRF